MKFDEVRLKMQHIDDEKTAILSCQVTLYENGYKYILTMSKSNHKLASFVTIKISRLIKSSTLKNTLTATRLTLCNKLVMLTRFKKSLSTTKQQFNSSLCQFAYQFHAC